MAKGDTPVNALLGAVATVILAGAGPVAPIGGGLVAGYLEGGSRDEGLRVGAISGAIALFPMVFMMVVVSNVLFFVAGGIPGLGVAAMLMALSFSFVYIVGLSAVGGWLGNYLKYDTDVGP